MLPIMLIYWGQTRKLPVSFYGGQRYYSSAWNWVVADTSSRNAGKETKSRIPLAIQHPPLARHFSKISEGEILTLSLIYSFLHIKMATYHSVLIFLLTIEGFKREIFTLRIRVNIFRESSDEDELHTLERIKVLNTKVIDIISTLSNMMVS